MNDYLYETFDIRRSAYQVCAVATRTWCRVWAMYKGMIAYPFTFDQPHIDLFFQIPTWKES